MSNQLFILNKNVKLVLFITVLFITGIGIFTIQTNAVYIPSSSQVFTCSGYVKDSYDRPIAGATLTLIYNSDIEVDAMESNDLEVATSGIQVSTTTSSSGYYKISITTTKPKLCTLYVYKLGYHSQSKKVFSKGSITVNFNLIIIPPKFIMKCAATDSITNNEVNTIEVEMIMHDNEAIATIRIRFKMGIGYISIYDCWPDIEHPMSRTAVLRDPADGSTTPLTETLDHYFNGYLWYDDQGFDFGNKVVEIDYQLRLRKAGGKPQFTIELFTIARMTANNIIGLQEDNLHNNKGQITFDEEDVFLTNYYLASWNAMVKTLFINDAIYQEWGRFMRLSVSLNSNVYGKFGYSRNPCPHFDFTWL
jgi:hypothetical protein